MIDIYEKCPVLENENFLLRLVEEKDTKNLLEVYSDKMVLPFLNSDSCRGDNFYYTTEERMLEAIKFWVWAYSNRAFVRFAIVNKKDHKAVGTIELFNRKATDYFNDCGIMRLDVRSDFEDNAVLCDIMSIILEPAYELFGCLKIATKAPLYAVERVLALEKMGFQKSEEYLVGVHDNRMYGDYWIVEK